MPTNATSRFLPPGTDNELEGIILDAAKLQWPAIEFSPNSVNGQAQNGVDIYGMTPEGRWIGIECKNSIRELRQDVIRDAVRAADTFRPPLERLYIATTAPDGSADEFIRKLTQDRLQAGKFPVFIWRWKQMVGALGRDLPTLYHHFPEQRPADWFSRGGLSPALRGIDVRTRTVMPLPSVQARRRLQNRQNQGWPVIYLPPQMVLAPGEWGMESLSRSSVRSRMAFGCATDMANW